MSGRKAPVLGCRFFATNAGAEPVRDWRASPRAPDATRLRTDSESAPSVYSETRIFRRGPGKARGRVDLQLFEGVGEAILTNDPGSAQAKGAIAKIIDFVHRELG